MPDVRDALVRTSGKRVLNLNLAVHQGETKGFRAVDHLTSLGRHAPELRLDVVLADPSVVDDADEVAAVASGLGARLVTSPIAATGRPGQHDALRLAAAYRDLMG
ncbi:MAG: Gluconeogenesis factor [bacterium ADurb.BinA028]|nr:MAG: Gluconeogenesis factor [bacterium ADurb.BinA028]